jgi:serine phosphatase RsbU (regulator of sigma subunit)
MRLFNEDLPLFQKASKEEIKSVVIPKPGETACGDGFYQSVNKEYIKIFLGDGLGHGPDAEHAVVEAGKSFVNCTETDPAEIIRSMNLGVKKTRGLVGTVAVFNIQARKWRICGVGNITTKIMSPTAAKNLMAYNGIIGLNVPRTLNAQEVTYEKGQYLILYSDGIKSKWDPAKYAAIQRYDASILAAAILKDQARQTDDMSVAVCKINL